MRRLTSSWLTGAEDRLARLERLRAAQLVDAYLDRLEAAYARHGLTGQTWAAFSPDELERLDEADIAALTEIFRRGKLEDQELERLAEEAASAIADEYRRRITGADRVDGDGERGSSSVQAARGAPLRKVLRVM